MAIVLVAGGGPSGEVIGFRYWHDPGPLVQYLEIPGSLGRFLGFWTTFSNAVYAYSSIETISMAAAAVSYTHLTLPTKRIV